MSDGRADAVTQHFTHEVMQYWLERGQAAARRLTDHGLIADCTLQQFPIPGTSKLITKLQFTMGAMGQIMLAELVADRLDALEQDARAKAREQGLEPPEGWPTGP